jgi:hypothetical protein
MSDRDFFTPVLFGIVGGGVAGAALVVANAYVSGIVLADAGRRGAMDPHVEFGLPVDRTGSLEYLAVQVLFLVVAIAVLVVGIRSARRAPFIAAAGIVAAIVMVVPFASCTVGAFQNAVASYAPG